MNDGSAFQKRRQVLEMLEAGLVMLHLDPRGGDVIVPRRFKTDPVLRLNIAYQFRLPALDVGADGIYAVLSFNKETFGCTLPWSSIFAATRPNAGHDGVVWPHSVPPELKASLSQAGIERPTRMRPATPLSMPGVPSGGDRGRGAAADDDERAQATAAGGEDAGNETAPGRRGHLKLVKG